MTYDVGAGCNISRVAAYPVLQRFLHSCVLVVLLHVSFWSLRNSIIRCDAACIRCTRTTVVLWRAGRPDSRRVPELEIYHSRVCLWLHLCTVGIPYTEYLSQKISDSQSQRRVNLNATTFVVSVRLMVTWIALAITCTVVPPPLELYMYDVESDPTGSRQLPGRL